MKILVSPGYGAGWSTREVDPQIRRFMLTYGPLIEAIERGEKIPEVFYPDMPAPDMPLGRFVEDFKQQFPDESVPYLGGAQDLKVVEVDGPFRITEYDGYERVQYPDDIEWQEP